MTQQDIDLIEDVIERILEVTQSPESRSFYRKTIARIGIGLAEELLGELRYQMKIQDIGSPAKYYTTLLKNELKGEDVQPSVDSTSEEVEKPESWPISAKTYLSSTAVDLFEELKPKAPAAGTIVETQVMPNPYSKNFIPWATMIGPEFFTLSSNKAKSDRVTLKVRTMDGNILEVPMIRGRIVADPKAKEHGILTPEHGRILGALELLWVQQGSKYVASDSGSLNCWCVVHIRELAKLIGWKSFGGRQMTDLKDKIFDLKSIPYYLEFENTKISKKGYPFTFLERMNLREIVDRGVDRSTIEITFSHQYSYQLLSRRVVTRPKEITNIKSEMAFLLRLYIESIVYKKDNQESYKVGLSKLVEILNLPSASWHKYKSLRRQQFLKAIKEMNTMKTADGRKFRVEIEKSSGDDDFLLLARLEQYLEKSTLS